MATKRRRKNQPVARRAPRRGAPLQVRRVQYIYEADPSADPEDKLFGDPAYEREDQERLDAFHRGEWHLGGVYAEAELVVAGTTQVVRTPGVWGIESDSERSFFTETAKEQFDELVDILAELGVPKSRIQQAAAEAQWEER